MENSRKVDSPLIVSIRNEELVQGCLQCLFQCESLLGMLDGTEYVHCQEGASSIGGHMRHILDRFQSFFTGLPLSCIDYDSRKRDKSIETNLDSANFALTTLLKRVSELSIAEDSSLVVRETVHPNGHCLEIPSTIERELMGLVSHSIHHLAIIALLAKDIGHEMDQSFGKAPSTIVFERK